MTRHIAAMMRDVEKRSVWAALKRGLVCRCPNCGRGRLFQGYTKVNPTCSGCGLDLAQFRADDAPPYFTIFLTGHIVLPAMLIVEQRFAPDLWIHAAIWLPLTVVLGLTLLPVTKGATIAIQWATRSIG